MQRLAKTIINFQKRSPRFMFSWQDDDKAKENKPS